VSEIVTWSGETFYSQSKIHIKNAKGKKDRMVMLPYSIVNQKEIYKTLPTQQIRFEGQFAGEPYSIGSAQQVMRAAIKNIIY
jgi:hypothetical protein